MFSGGRVDSALLPLIIPSSLFNIFFITKYTMTCYENFVLLSSRAYFRKKSFKGTVNVTSIYDLHLLIVMPEAQGYPLF